MRKPPRRSSALKVHVRELNMTPVARYVDIQRERGHMIAIGQVDVDLETLAGRNFLCDRHRCIQWTPHDQKADARPLIDNSCCASYSVPVGDIDRRKLAEILPLVKKRLAKTHPLNVDATAAPYRIDEDDFSFVMNEYPSGACQFVLYEKGMTTCSIHKTCLEEGLNVWEYKPLGCSLWPLALVDYEDENKKERYLLTIYSTATKSLFDSADDAHDDGNFACLMDNDEKYEPLYKSCEGVLKFTLGDSFYKQLDRAAREYVK
jgi:hypothetical protein